jgi:hypothetical protein
VARLGRHAPIAARIGAVVGTVGAANLCTIHTETPAYTIDMSFPADYPEKRALADVLTRQQDQFVTTVEEPPARDVPKALAIKPTNVPLGHSRARHREPGARGVRQQLPGAPVNENLIGADMYKSFALTDAVIFYIGQGMWAIEAAGPQQVSVPRRELASILA